MIYRAEIDGLRALAVLPVMLFHAGFEPVSGGFVGVDVFFVISGYLITTILIKEMESSRFSLVDFYERRARRILPALFFVMLCCLPFAWLHLLPHDFLSFSQSLIAVPTFVSNIVFWKTSGYFEPLAELNPLLHTWSLAVEEQYYLIFPLFLMLTWRAGKGWVLGLLGVAFVASIVVAQWFSLTRPAAAFYLLPTRGWELLIGVFVAFLVTNTDLRKPTRVLSELGSLLGLSLIAYAIFAFDERTPFPGVYALVPTVGTALLIFCANSKTLIGKLLANRILVAIGLISYSAYLWHQPVFAFAKYQSNAQFGTVSMLGLVALSLVLAAVSWKYVEQPFRDKSRFSRSRVFALSLFGSVMFVSVGVAGVWSNGIEARLSQRQLDFLDYFENNIPEWRFFTRLGIPSEYNMRCSFFDVKKYRAGQITHVPVNNISEECYARDSGRSKAVLIWGDSHAQMLHSGLTRALPKTWQLLQVASSGCFPQLDAESSTTDYCQQSNWFAYNTVLEARPEVVVVGQIRYHEVAKMRVLAERLIQAGVKKVVFTGPTPHWVTPLPTFVVKHLDKPPRTANIALNQDVLRLDETLKKELKQTDAIRFVSLIDHFCTDKGCAVYLGDDVTSGIVSWDAGHLTPIASFDLARKTLVREIIGDSE